MDRDDWKNWKKQPWASREAKQEETLEEGLFKNTEHQVLQKCRKENAADPKAFIKKIKDIIDSHRSGIKQGLQSGDIIAARESDSHFLRKMQKAIDEMAAEAGMQTPLQLVVHRSSSPMRLSSGLLAEVTVPEFIEINDGNLYSFGKQEKFFKTVLAHELAHIVNGDTTVEDTVKQKLNPPNQKMEVLADRMGAIFYGNPREYAKIHEEDMMKAQPYDRIYFTKKYLSPNGQARMLHKWADILEREGATDKNGNVIMEPDEQGNLKPLKALKIFERSKQFAEDLVKIDQTIRSR